MKVTYDSRADAMYITLKGHGVDHTVRVGPDIAIDYGPDGEIHGIEILASREHLGFRSERPEIIVEHVVWDLEFQRCFKSLNLYHDDQNNPRCAADHIAEQRSA